METGVTLPGNQFCSIVVPGLGVSHNIIYCKENVHAKNAGSLEAGGGIHLPLLKRTLCCSLPLIYLILSCLRTFGTRLCVCLSSFPPGRMVISLERIHMINSIT